MALSTTGAGREPAVVRWLRGDDSDRRRYAAMHQRLRRASSLTAAVVATKVLASWWYGPVLLVLLGLAVLTMAGGIAWHRRARHPEVVAALAFLVLQVITAAAVLVSGGASSPLLPLLAVPVFSQAVCFRPQVFVAGVLTSAVMACPAVLLADLLPPAPGSPPFVHLAGYLALLANVAVAGHFLVSADRSSRDEAVIDPMTGLFNRLTLSDQFTAAQRLAREDRAVGLVMCDVDRFKQINDTYGHDRGDRVLQELADRLRASLRDSDTAYRVGGEEFVVLLPGHDAPAAAAVAERIRRAVRATPLAGLPVTISAGVLSAGGGDGVTLAELLRDADAALYAAKEAGRDRVVAVPPGARNSRRGARPVTAT